MVSFENLKLSKPLISAMAEAGYLKPTSLQEACIKRIIGGQDLLLSAPAGAGKTTTLALITLMRVRYGFEEAPRALILVPDKARVLEMVERFELLNRNTSIRIIGIHADDPIDRQVNEITDGVDIIVAVPARARAVYLKLGLNTNKIQLFAIDDADDMVRAGMQLPVNELANALKKCQKLVFTNALNDRVKKMIDAFLPFPTLIEIEAK